MNDSMLDYVFSLPPQRQQFCFKPLPLFNPSVLGLDYPPDSPMAQFVEKRYQIFRTLQKTAGGVK